MMVGWDGDSASPLERVTSSDQPDVTHKLYAGEVECSQHTFAFAVEAAYK